MDNPDGNHKDFREDGTIIYRNFKAPLWYIKTRNAINYILGVIEVLLAFRFLFKLLGANSGSGFVSFLYSLTGIVIYPFAGIFNSYATNGPSAKFIFEPAAIIGMLVYGVIGWGLIHLIRLKAVRDGH